MSKKICCPEDLKNGKERYREGTPIEEIWGEMERKIEACQSKAKKKLDDAMETKNEGALELAIKECQSVAVDTAAAEELWRGGPGGSPSIISPSR